MTFYSSTIIINKGAQRSRLTLTEVWSQLPASPAAPGLSWGWLWSRGNGVRQRWHRRRCSGGQSFRALDCAIRIQTFVWQYSLKNTFTKMYKCTYVCIASLSLQYIDQDCSFLNTVNKAFNFWFVCGVRETLLSSSYSDYGTLIMYVASIYTKNKINWLILF